MNNFSSTAAAAFISICLFLSTVIGVSAQQIEWSDVDVDRYQINEQAIGQASRVLGFVSAQNAAVDTLAQQYPQAADDLIKQKLLFEAKFG